MYRSMLNKSLYETVTPTPHTPYGKKLVAEEMLVKAIDRLVVFRFSNAWGEITKAERQNGLIKKIFTTPSIAWKDLLQQISHQNLN